MDLWKFYLGYIRRINAGDGGGSAATPESRSVIEKAYEYVLGNVGTDKDAGPIWADYIFFLKSAEVSLFPYLSRFDSTPASFCVIDNEYLGRTKEDGQYASSLSEICGNPFEQR